MKTAFDVTFGSRFFIASDLFASIKRLKPLSKRRDGHTQMML
jgi:hypothetical protein